MSQQCAWHTARLKKIVVSVGVYTGFSALSVALVLPDDGVVIACDISAEFPDVGKPCWKEAGVQHKIDLRIAPAAHTLRTSVSHANFGLFVFHKIFSSKNFHARQLLRCLVKSCQKFYSLPDFLFD